VRDLPFTYHAKDSPVYTIMYPVLSTKAQRSTYFLQLPYNSVIPLMVVCGLMHWLCSQSIFLVQIRADQTNSRTITTLGWSPQAVLVTLSVGFLMGMFIIVLGRLKKFSNGMPVASTCSAAISSMCRVPKVEDGD
jgi:hypothetical protein